MGLLTSRVRNSFAKSCARFFQAFTIIAVFNSMRFILTVLPQTVKAVAEVSVLVKNYVKDATVGKESKEAAY